MVEKLEAGKGLLKKFAIPPGEPNADDPEWQLFCDYCQRDVEAMRACIKLMLRAPAL